MARSCPPPDASSAYAIQSVGANGAPVKLHEQGGVTRHVRAVLADAQERRDLFGSEVDSADGKECDARLFACVGRELVERACERANLVAQAPAVVAAVGRLDRAQVTGDRFARPPLMRSISRSAANE